MSLTTRYPLAWPQGRARTPPAQRTRARFATTFAKARDELFCELQRLHARSVILSTSVELRSDGIPYANRREPDDPGAAVYFSYGERAVCFACDRWDRVQDNVHAIGKTIEALRGIARWGTGDMLDAAFSGFAALPSGSAPSWAVRLNVRANATVREVEDAYRQLVLLHHPDRGGDQATMVEINRAYAAFKTDRGL